MPIQNLSIGSTPVPSQPRYAARLRSTVTWPATCANYDPNAPIKKWSCLEAKNLIDHGVKDSTVVIYRYITDQYQIDQTADTLKNLVAVNFPPTPAGTQVGPVVQNTNGENVMFPVSDDFPSQNEKIERPTMFEAPIGPMVQNASVPSTSGNGIDFTQADRDAIAKISQDVTAIRQHMGF